MRIFHRCKHLWFYEGPFGGHISLSGRMIVKSKYICAKCGRIKMETTRSHKHMFSRTISVAHKGGKWESAYNQFPIYKE